MIGPAGTHGSSFPVHYETFVDMLEDAGYKVGYTGKGWGPGDWLGGGRDKNPAGVEYNDAKQLKKPKTGISDTSIPTLKQAATGREIGCCLVMTVKMRWVLKVFLPGITKIILKGGMCRPLETM